LLNREVPEDIRAWEARRGTDTAVEPVIIAANDDLKMQARICIPLIHRGVRTGLLFVIDPLAPNDPARVTHTVAVIADQVTLLAALLYEMASPISTSDTSGKWISSLPAEVSQLPCPPSLPGAQSDQEPPYGWPSPSSPPSRASLRCPKHAPYRYD
jgi:hypothetical protein